MRSFTRRETLFAAAAALLARGSAADMSKLSAEGYIFQQYAERQEKRLSDVLDEVIPMARQAGFRNVELNPSFFAPEVKDKTLALVRANGLRMPSVYYGGVMHDTVLASQTIDRALQIARLCQPSGCSALVFNADPKGFKASQPIEKTDAELATQAAGMNRMGRLLRDSGFELRIHNHAPEMVSHAREWRFVVAHTDPKYVSFCVDLNWVWVGGEDPLGILKEAGSRARELHVRNERNKVWLENLEDGDTDYRAIAKYLRNAKLEPLIVVELAYMKKTSITRPLEEDLAISRKYAEKTFGIEA